MKMTQKLDFLMDEKGINKNQLALLADIPYTTIDGIYKRGYENIKLPTLKKLSAFFGVTMEYLSNDNISFVKPQEKAPTVEDTAEAIIGFMQNRLGRYPTESEMLLLQSMVSGILDFIEREHEKNA